MSETGVWTRRWRWSRTAGTALFVLALLYPLSGFFARIGPWQWAGEGCAAAMASVRVSLGLTAAAMAIIVALGTPVAVYLACCGLRERLLWLALLLIPILLPALALGILFRWRLGLAFPWGRRWDGSAWR